ncbi:MAG: hypothetical protein KGL39_10680 [Patescibacteria group bacterium]|nr:hypothetical protein [Patescibacteria group bacterium]
MKFSKMFERLSEQDRSIVLHLLERALLWRGWAKLGSARSMTDEIEGIAQVFRRNGFEIAEYT